MLFLFFVQFSRLTLASDIPTPVVLLDANFSNSTRTLFIDAAILRYVPKQGQKSPPQFTKYKSVSEILDAMNQSGAGDEMYRGFHSLSGWPQATVSLTAFEHRPAFRYGAVAVSKPLAGNVAAPTEPVRYSTFGLNLKISAAPPLSGDMSHLALAWDGNYSWSTNFIPKQIWESVLMGVMTAGQLAGAGFTEQDHSESTGLRRDGGQSVGKDLVSLFKRKKPAATSERGLQAASPPNGKIASQSKQSLSASTEPQSYLDALRQERHLNGQLDLYPAQLAFLPINSDNADALELFYLVLRYEFE